MSRNWVSKKESGKDINFKFETEGQELEGFLIETMEDRGTKKDSCIHVVKTEAGEEKVFWGTKVIDDQFSKISFGAYIMVKYLGKKKAKGGNQYHDFEVFEDTSAEGVTVPQQEQTKAEPVVAGSDDAFEDDDDALPF
jgi:hypothetical protein